MTSPLEGKRVRLISCSDPYTKLTPGIKGTVRVVDDLGTVHVLWDNGSRLGLCAEDGDSFAVISPTFEQFRATGKDCDDLGEALADDLWSDSPAAGRGRLYLNALYIERKPVAGWPNGRAEEWALCIGRDDWLTDDLEELERRLYQFAIDEGYEL